MAPLPFFHWSTHRFCSPGIPSNSSVVQVSILPCPCLQPADPPQRHFSAKLPQSSRISPRKMMVGRCSILSFWWCWTFSGGKLLNFMKCMLFFFPGIFQISSMVFDRIQSWFLFVGIHVKSRVFLELPLLNGMAPQLCPQHNTLFWDDYLVRSPTGPTNGALQWSKPAALQRHLHKISLSEWNLLATQTRKLGDFIKLDPIIGLIISL